MFCSCFCLYGPFNCISFHTFSRELSAFSLWSSGLTSASFVLSTRYHFMKVSFNPDIIFCGWLDLKHQLTQFSCCLLCGVSEYLSRIAQTTAALTRLKPIWFDKSISLSSKILLMRSLVTSTFLYACESWTLTAELHRRIRAMEMGCYHKILHLSHKDHVTNEEVHAKIQQPRQLDHMKTSWRS